MVYGIFMKKINQFAHIIVTIFLKYIEKTMEMEYRKKIIKKYIRTFGYRKF